MAKDLQVQLFDAVAVSLVADNAGKRREFAIELGFKF
jgi:hypothetical protein